LSTLTKDQLALLAGSHSEDRSAIAWLAVAKHSPFVFEFASEVLYGKVAAHDSILRPSDYEAYFSSKAVAHPELGRLTDHSRAKLRQVLICMLKEAGAIKKGPELGIIHRPLLSAEVARAIADDSPVWLSAFLVPMQEIGIR
jgi:hypothetical protein